MCTLSEHPMMLQQEKFETFDVHGITVFIQRDLLENETIQFTIPGAGEYSVRIVKTTEEPP